MKLNLSYHGVRGSFSFVFTFYYVLKNLTIFIGFVSKWFFWSQMFLAKFRGPCWMVGCMLRICLPIHCLVLDLLRLILGSIRNRPILLGDLGNHLLGLVVLLDFGISYIVVSIWSNIYLLSFRHQLIVHNSRKGKAAESLGLFVERNFKCPSWLTMLWPSAISSKLKSSFADCTGLTRNFTLRCMIKATGRTKHSLEEMRIMVNYVLFMLCFKKKKNYQIHKVQNISMRAFICSIVYEIMEDPLVCIYL